jgi:O-antigen/teichoic acid export membrane protein
MKLKHSYNYITGSFIQALIPILFYPILTKITDKESFGKLVTAIAFSTILSYLFSLGLPAIISRQLIFDKKNSLKLKKYIDFVSKFLLLFLFFFNLIIYYFNIIDTIKLIILIISGSIFLAFAQIKLSIYRAEFKSLNFIFLAVGSNGLPLIITTLVSLLSNLNLIYIYFFSLFIILLLFTGKFSLNFVNKPPVVNSLIKSGLPMIVHGISISSFQYGDKIVGFLGVDAQLAAEIAILSLVLTGPTLLLNTLNNVWLPSSLEMYTRSKKIGQKYSNNIAQKLTLITSLIILIIFLGLPFFLQLIVSQDYDLLVIEKTIYLSIFVSPLYILYLQNSQIITVNKQFKVLGFVTPISALIQFIFTFLFVKNLGLYAVGYGFIIAIFLQTFLTSVLTKNYKKIYLFPVYVTFFLGFISVIFYFIKF